MSLSVRACIDPARERQGYYLWIDLYAPGECPVAGQELDRWATVTSAGTVRNWHSRDGARDYIELLGEEIADLWKERG